MSDDMGLLTFLGESADWLKDSADVSIREHRLATIEAFRASWSDAGNDERHEAFKESIRHLFIALRHNSLVPDSVLMKRSKTGDVSFLPSTDNFTRDFESLLNYYGVNKFGIGEVHLLNAVLHLHRLQDKAEEARYDLPLEEAVGNVLFLRDPTYRADNVSPFSSELQAHFHAIRVLRCMRKLGLCDEDTAPGVTREDQVKMTELMADPICAQTGKHIPKRHLAAFRILDRASALQAYARAHAANRLANDPRSPEELFSDLRQRMRKLPAYTVLGPMRRQRLFKLGMASVVRSMAHTDTVLGLKMYAFLRNRAHPTHLRHASMFKLLPNINERLRFLNFLCTHAKQNPMYFIKRFQRFFGDNKLRFVGKEAGFTLEKARKREKPARKARRSKPAKEPDSETQ